VASYETHACKSQCNESERDRFRDRPYFRCTATPRSTVPALIPRTVAGLSASTAPLSNAASVAGAGGTPRTAISLIASLISGPIVTGTTAAIILYTAVATAIIAAPGGTASGSTRASTSPANAIRSTDYVPGISNGPTCSSAKSRAAATASPTRAPDTRTPQTAAVDAEAFLHSALWPMVSLQALPRISPDHFSRRRSGSFMRGNR